MPRFDRSASMDSSSTVLRASRSGLVTISTSLSRRKARHSASFARSAMLDTCSPKMCAVVFVAQRNQFFENPFD